MSYEFLATLPNGNQRYKVTLNVYRDCFQSEVPLDDDIQLGVYLNDNALNRYTIVDFSLVTKTNVQPPGSVDCDFYAKNVCIEYGLYEGTVDLAPFSGGYHLTFVRCCRNLQDNLPNQDNKPYQGQTYYCYIPNTTYQNSSPVFSGVPSPYMCANDTTEFLFNAIDPDGDELSYRIVRPFQGGSPTQTGAIPTPPPNLTLPIQPVVYNGGYNSNRPFGTSNGSISTVDAVTGLTTFFAPNTGSYVVCIEVTERRNGVVLSTIRMDLQILVLNCPPNLRPTLSTPGGQNFTVEAGSELCFNVTGTDPDGDNVKLTADGPVLTGLNGFTGTRAIFEEKTGNTTVTSEFCWDTDCDHARDEPYIVSVTVEDDGCPPKFNYLDFQITVTPFVGTTDFNGPSIVCQFETASYTATGGQSTSTYQWEATNGTIRAGLDETVVIDWDGAGTGKVRMREISQHGCFGEWVEQDVTISESPALPIIAGPDTVCLNQASLTYSVGFNGGNSYAWSATNATLGSIVANNVGIASYSAPSFTLALVETNAAGCPSDTAFKEVHVSEPMPTFTGPRTVCPNAENIQYISSNNAGSIYTWTVLGGTQVSGGNTNQIGIDWGNEGLGSVSVIETNRHGCISPPIIRSVNKTYDLEVNDVIGPTEVCEFDLGVEYTTLAVSGSKFIWNITGGNQASGDSNNIITVDWDGAGPGIVSMRETAFDKVNNRLCLSPEYHLNVTIHPRPTATEISGLMEVCQEADSVTYSVAGFAGSTYEWAIDGNTSGISGQGTNTVKIFWNAAGFFTLSVIETSINNCPGNLIDTVILVNPKPTTSPISGNAVVCPESVSGNVYSVTGFATSDFQWGVYGANQFTGQGTPDIVVDWEPSLASGGMSVVEISDKGCPGDTQLFDVEIDRLAIDMRFVTVGTPDDHMVIEWKLKEPTLVDEFRVQKRNPVTAAWETIATVNGAVNTYTERNLDTDASSYDYRISATNKCGTEILSETHTSILLTGYQDENFNINIRFSDYFGWDNGVDNYIVYESINNGSYVLKNSGLNPNENQVIINDPDQYKKCYRVYAKELQGEETYSWSNEICFFFSPEVYVPNAFTANNDFLNDGFGVKGIAINEFNMKIYNRWGEKLFETENINERWIPVYRNKDVPQGAYVYLITYTNFENKVFTKTGTVTLLR